LPTQACTIITSAVVLFAAAATMLDNRIDRNRKLNDTNKRIDKTDKISRRRLNVEWVDVVDVRELVLFSDARRC